MAVEWLDEGIVLAHRLHGEHSVLLDVFTQDHGRCLGFVPGGNVAARRPLLQPGYHLNVRWAARLPEQMGQWSLDAAKDYAAQILSDRGRLAVLSSACALCAVCLPERQPYPAIYGSLKVLLDGLMAESWASLYVHWELALLRGMGYGLDLSRCAATGMTEDLVFVSPKSGRAVSAEAGRPYRDRLLPLPAFLLDGREGGREAIRNGLILTGYFLSLHVLPPHCRGELPPARSRLMAIFQA